MADYSKGLFKQLAEQTEKAERLEAENKELKAENKGLKAKVENLEAKVDNLTANLEALIATAVSKAVEPLNVLISHKEEKIQKANDEIDRLKAVIDKDSNNSSKPPSSNGLRKVSNSREPSGKKVGGQRGHKGHCLSIPKNLEELVKEGKAQHVVRDETGGARGYVTDWIVDIVTMPVYTEVRRAPGKPPSVAYGEEIQARAVYLTNVGMLSLNRLAEYFAVMTCGLITPSEAALLSFSERVGSRVDLESLIQELLNGIVMHVDDTPVRVTQRPDASGEKMEKASHTTLSGYVRVCSNESTTVLTANAHKDAEGVKRDGILPRFLGTVVHDHEAKFYGYGKNDATCGAHLCRELKGLEELGKVEWGGRMRAFMLEMDAQKEEDLAGNKTACDPLRLRLYETCYDELVAQGAEILKTMRKKSLGQDDLRKMVKRLCKYKDAYLLFMRDYRIPFTNNQAERDVRHCKTKEKISGCFRSWSGLKTYCLVRSLIDTTRKRGQNVMLALRACFAPCPG